MATENPTTSPDIDPRTLRRMERRRPKRRKETRYFQVVFDHTLPDGTRVIYDPLSPRLYSHYQCIKALKNIQRSTPEAYAARCRQFH